MDGALAHANELRDLGDAQPAVELCRRSARLGVGDALRYKLIEPGVDRRGECGGEGLGELGVVGRGWRTHLAPMSLCAAK